MFNNKNGLSMRELKKARKLYWTDQRRYFHTNPTGIRWRFNRNTLKGCASRVPDHMPNNVLLRCSDVAIITERQFVFKDSNFYAYSNVDKFKSFKWLLPHYSIYDVHIEKAFVSFGYCHNKLML